MVATEGAILSNFLLNDRCTFRDRERSHCWLGRAWRYNPVALGGLTLSVGTLAVLTRVWDLEYLAANLVAIGAATLRNYAVNSRLTWSPAR